MDFLKEKWTYYFKLLDINHDGVVSKAEIDQTLKDFPGVEGLDEVTSKDAVAKIEKWWNTYILKGRQKVTQEEFVQDFERQYTEDKASFIKYVETLAEEIISIIDTDKTKRISLDNYVKVFKVWGHDNEALLRKSFELYKPDHGEISIQEYLDDWMIFFTNDDPSKPDVVMDTYKKGLI